MDTPHPDQPALASATSAEADRVRMQQALDTDKDFFSRILQNIAAPLFVIDIKHTVLIWNNALAKLTGKSSFQMKGTKQHWTAFYPAKRPTLADLVLDRSGETIHELYAQAVASQFADGAYRAEGWFDAIGGKRRYLFFEAATIVNSRNEIVAAVETIEDITDRKRAQEAMADKNQFLQEILEAMPNPVFCKNTLHAFIGCNKAFSAFFGITEQEVLGKTLADIVTPELAQASITTDQEIIESRRSMTYETPMVRCDGATRKVLVTKAPLSNTDGSLVGIVGTFVDVTEQRLLDEQVKKLSLAVEQSPATIVITDPQGSIEYVNSKFSQITGYTQAEAIGQNPRILKSGNMPAESYTELWNTITSGNEWRGEFHNKRKNGELFWEYATISPLTDKNGRITAFLGVKEDITSRKETEAALLISQMELLNKHQELELVFEQVKIAKREWEETLDSLKDFVILTDSGHRVRRCNRLLCDITARTFNEVIGRDWRELLSEAGFDFTSFNGSHGELIQKTSRRQYELNIYRMTAPNSELVTGFVVSLNDTTEIRAVTEELTRTSKELADAQHAVFQQEKLASIGQLAAGVAHEINNPMGFISSNLGTLGKYMDKMTGFENTLIEVIQEKGDPGIVSALADLRKKMKIDFILNDIRGLLEESCDGAERVRRIVQDLKSFSHLDEAQRKPFSINECLESTLNMARNEIKYVADVEREYDENLPLLECYPQQLNQVFMNLLVNAAHAMEGHGTIRIKTLREDDDIIVKVSDTGKGIEPEILTRIFEPFFTTKEVGKGTGLGLSISYDIIKKHGGVMTVESEVGSGTTFTIRLPMKHVFEEPQK